MKTEIFENYEAFSKRDDKTINGISAAFLRVYPLAQDERGNKGCWNCSRCSGCSRCSDCSRCSGCSRCSPQKIANETPKIENIHTRLLEAVSVPDALNMGNWHTCETTHCRAGWIVHLAGNPGKQLETETSTLFAAMQIYRASSPIRVSPVRFFESNEKAMKDIRRCAELEATPHP